MKYYALIIISISIISIISCSGNTGHILSKLEEYIYTGYYKKAEDLFSRIDTDKMDDSFMSRYMLLKGYLKYEQGYWGMAEKILDKVQPFENKRVALFLQILYGFLSLSF